MEHHLVNPKLFDTLEVQLWNGEEYDEDQFFDSWVPLLGDGVVYRLTAFNAGVSLSGVIPESGPACVMN